LKAKQIRVLLQARDLEALILLYWHWFLLRDHIHILCFSRADRRRVLRRLKRLIDAGLIAGEPLPLGAFPLGLSGLVPHPGQFAYRLLEPGIHLVAQALEIDADLARRRLRAAPSYVGHAVAVASLHVALRQFEEAQGYRLEQFLTECEARLRFEWREGSSKPWTVAEVRPDALAWIEREEKRVPVLLEADLCTQGKVAFAKKLAGYALAVGTGVMARRFGDSSLRLGIVTTSPSRLRTLASLVRESDISGLTVALTTFGDFLTQGPHSPIWHVPTRGTERYDHALFDL
jgi:hypothetical protein